MSGATAKMAREEKNIEKLTDALVDCEIEEKSNAKYPSILLSETCDATLLAKFPKPKNKVPPIFIHKPVKFTSHMRKVLNLGIKFYRPIVGHHYTKICCQTFSDQRAFIQYLDNKNLPYHTYGLPQKRKMKVVFRGLPKDLDLNQLKKELKSVSIPIIRVHIMHNTERAKDLPPLILAVVPNNDEGRKILQVQKLYGHDVKIEPPKPRDTQCYRCQKWGHSQRYCHGQIKCVKCGDDHPYKKCTRDPAKEPPKCANCLKDHTANYKLCPYSPSSLQYIKKRVSAANKQAMFSDIYVLPKKLVTLQNCHLIRGERCK